MTEAVLTDWLRAKLIERANAAAPQEACGLISRAPGVIGYPEGGITLWHARNAAPDPEASFAIESSELLWIAHMIGARQETLIGVYHSHPKGIPAPSPLDLEIAAQWPGLTWFIVGKDDAGDPALWTGVLA